MWKRARPPRITRSHPQRRPTGTRLDVLSAVIADGPDTNRSATGPGLRRLLGLTSRRGREHSYELIEHGMADAEVAPGLDHPRPRSHCHHRPQVSVRPNLDDDGDPGQ